MEIDSAIVLESCRRLRNRLQAGLLAIGLSHHLADVLQGNGLLASWWVAKSKADGLIGRIHLLHVWHLRSSCGVKVEDEEQETA